MTKISAKVVEDSIYEESRITTILCVLPRFILAELNTHRMFSKNSASSRAIPFNKMVEIVEKDPFIPIAWQKEHKGMQGTEYATYPDTEDFKSIWLEARDNAIKSAQLAQTGYVKLTKQLCNRLLEPFMWSTVLITATEWENFFALRCPQYGGTDRNNKEVYFKSKKDALKHLKELNVNIENLSLDDTLGWLKINKGQAEIHMMELAECIYDAINESIPKELKENEWHIPFGDNISNEQLELLIQKNISKGGINTHIQSYEREVDDKKNKFKIKIATARCARTSYTTIEENDKKYNYEKDIELHDKLLKEGHFSPFEHCARCMNDVEYESFHKGEFVPSIDEISEDIGMALSPNAFGWCNNFKGFIQYRYFIESKMLI